MGTVTPSLRESEKKFFSTALNHKLKKRIQVKQSRKSKRKLTMQHSCLGRAQSAPGLLCYVSQKAVGQHCNQHPKVHYYSQGQPVNKIEVTFPCNQ